MVPWTGDIGSQVTTLSLPTVTSHRGSWRALIRRTRRFISGILLSSRRQVVQRPSYMNYRELQLWYLTCQRVSWLCYLWRHYLIHSMDGWRLTSQLLCKMLSVGLGTYKILCLRTSLHKTYQSAGKQGKDSPIEGMVEQGHTTRFEKEELMFQLQRTLGTRPQMYG